MPEAWTRPPGWAATRATSPWTSLPCSVTVWPPCLAMEVAEGEIQNISPGHYPKLTPGGAAGRVGKDRVARSWAASRGDPGPHPLPSSSHSCHVRAWSRSVPLLPGPWGSPGPAPKAAGNQGETGRARDGPHLAVEVRNQPQRDEALRLAGLPRFVHKHVCEVPDSRAKGVGSGQPASICPGARRAGLGRRHPRRPVRSPNEPPAAAGLCT